MQKSYIRGIYPDPAWYEYIKMYINTDTVSPNSQMVIDTSFSPKHLENIYSLFQLLKDSSLIIDCQVESERTDTMW